MEDDGHNERDAIVDEPALHSRGVGHQPEDDHHGDAEQPHSAARAHQAHTKQFILARDAEDGHTIRPDALRVHLGDWQIESLIFAASSMPRMRHLCCLCMPQLAAFISFLEIYIALLLRCAQDSIDIGPNEDLNSIDFVQLKPSQIRLLHAPPLTSERSVRPTRTRTASC